MKILIIVPTEGYNTNQFRFKTSSDFPTGLAYIASALKKVGHEVDGLNPNNDVSFDSPREMLKYKLRAKLGKKNYDIVCLGGICIHYSFLKSAIKLIRKESPKSLVICGGGIITNDAEFMFKALRPDFSVFGEGEETLVSLLDAIGSTHQNFENIANIGYWEEDKACFTKISYEYGDFDEREFPDYSIFDMKDMLDHGGLHNRSLYRYTRNNPRVMPIITAVGCPFKCTFCVHDIIHQYKARSIEKIMAEIKQMYEQYKFNVLVVLDELFGVKKEWLRSFAQELIRHKELYNWDFDWLFQTHANARLTREDLEMLKESGCFYFSYGIESTSDKVLKSMKKKIKPSQISEAIDLSREIEIGFGGNFIFGDPVEDIHTVMESLSFFEKHCLEAHVNLGVIHPYPGSKLFDDYCSENDFTDTDKINFYENIDQGYFNLTTMSDDLWALISREVFVAALLRWEKTTKAISCSREENSPEVLWAKKDNFGVYQITVDCPYCSTTRVLRELINFTSKRRVILENSKKNKFIFNIDFDTSSHGQIFDEISNIKKLLARVTKNKNIDETSVIAGCPSCHRRMNIHVCE